MIAAETLTFLKKLRQNNNKVWFDKNKPVYLSAKENFIETVQQLIELISLFDSGVKGLEAKKCVFRINRDIRFAKDKSPYKSNFGASISPGGKKSQTPGYYFHLEPGNSFFAGGLYMPLPDALNAVRQEIDYNTNEFKTILSNKIFKKYYKALDESDKLKTAPKGFPKDHPAIELLKFKSYIVVHELKDSQLQPSGPFLKHAKRVFSALYPLNNFLRRAMD